ncbi:MAG: hypothetical protein ABI647_07130 [Gemmatimonadota bacterium]
MRYPDRLFASIAFVVALGACVNADGSAQGRKRGVGTAERTLTPANDTSRLNPTEQAAVLKRVTPYHSRMRYEAIYNGGKISLGAVRADSVEVAAFRTYLFDMTRAFRRQDLGRYFRTKGALPGAKGLTERAGFIVYEFRPLPWGGEIYLLTGDPAALVAIKDFIKYQREINTPS